MDLLERCTAYSYNRQKLGENAGSVETALKAVVAIYATHPTAPLTLWARTRAFTARTYRNLDRTKKAVRIPAMRRTVFLVPRSSAPRVFAATKATSAHAHRPLKKLGISLSEYEREAKRILAYASQPRTARDLERLGLEGHRLTVSLRALRYEGRIVTLAGGSLHTSPHRYVATDSWLGEELGSGDAEASLAWLAGEYLRAYGPARVTDFAWWSGATKTSARKAVETHETIELDDGLLLPAKDEAPFERTKRVKGAVAILPRWDAYTMGFAPDGRARFVDPDIQKDVYSPLDRGLAGDGNPAVLVDGKVVALWLYSQKEGLRFEPFEKLPTRVQRKVDDKLDEVVGLLSR